MTNIFTSYFDNVKNLPDSFEPIAICGGIPSNWKGKWTRIVAPKKGFFNEWKYVNHDNEYYIKHFKEEVLDFLNPEEVIMIFNTLSNGKIPCLICYEKPSEFCHRHLVSKWLNESLENVNCREYLINIDEKSEKEINSFTII